MPLNAPLERKIRITLDQFLCLATRPPVVAVALAQYGLVAYAVSLRVDLATTAVVELCGVVVMLIVARAARK
jgi:hypothetical protein